MRFVKIGPSVSRCHHVAASAADAHQVMTVTSMSLSNDHVVTSIADFVFVVGDDVACIGDAVG